MIQTAEKSIPCFFRCVFFFSAILFIQDLPRDLTDSPTRKKGKNKQTQGSAHLPKSAASLSNKISAKISRWRRPVTNIRTELHKQSRSFEETDRSEIERKSTCSIIELLLSEALPGYDLLKMTIVFVQVAFELEVREVNTGNIPFTTSSKREG